MTHTKNPAKAAERTALKDVRRAARRELAAMVGVDPITRRPRIPGYHYDIAAYDITSPTGQSLGGHMTFREALLVESILGRDGWTCVTRRTAAQKRTAKRWAAAGIGAN